MRTYLSISNRNSNCFTNEITSKINSNNRWIILFNKALRVKNTRTLFFYFTAPFLFIVILRSQLQLLINSYKSGKEIMAVPINTAEKKTNQYIQNIILQIRFLKKSFYKENNLNSYNFIKRIYFSRLIALESFTHHTI
jgi:hypothetical protein